MDPADYWEQAYGQQAKNPKATTTVVPIEASDPLAHWESLYAGKKGPVVQAAPAVKAAPVPQSTPMEQRAQEAEKAGKKFWNVNAPYAGAMERAQAHYADLIAHGASPKEALFLTGAAAAESDFNHAAVHDNGTGYGLYGHRLDRLSAMRKFTGTQFPDASQQNAFALQELRSRPEYKLIQNAKDARDLAIAQMHYERPKGYTPDDPTAGLNFAGRLNTLNKFTPLMGEKPEIERGRLAPEWGALESLGSGVALGFGPQLNAAYKSVRTGAPYAATLADLKRQQAFYKQQNPLLGYGAEALGTMAPVGLGMRAARPLIEAGATALEGAMPGVGRFMAGEAGQAVPLGEAMTPGWAGTGLRAASSGAQGAGQAIGQTALEQGSQALGGSLGDNETPVLQQFGQNALMGGVLGAGLSRFMQPSKAFVPEWEPGVRDIGREAFDAGISVYPGQFAKGEAKEFFQQAIPKSELTKQVKELSEKAAEKVGAKKLTPEELEKAKQVAQQSYDTFESMVGPMRPTRGAIRKLVDVYNQASTLRDPAMRKTVEHTLAEVIDDINAGKLNGQVFRKYIQTGGPIDTKLLGLDNPLKKHFGGQIREALETLLQQNDPAAAEMLRRTNVHYKDIKSLEKVAQASGVADPRALAKVVAKRGSGSGLADLAKVGPYMPRVDATGEAIVSQGTHSPEALKRLAKYGMFGAIGSVAEDLPVIGAVLRAGGPITQGAANVAKAVLAGATAATAREANRARIMRKPTVRKQIFEETYGPNKRAAGRRAVRPLLHGAVEYNPLFGGDQ